MEMDQSWLHYFCYREFLMLYHLKKITALDITVKSNI